MQVVGKKTVRATLEGFIGKVIIDVACLKPPDPMAWIVENVRKKCEGTYVPLLPEDLMEVI